MSDLTGYQKYLERILASNEFASSQTYRDFLKYLFEAAVQEKELKELTIAVDFFEKSADFNPAFDTTVRSHIYKLRKKLETYYLKEGREDKFRLRIPKGHYKLIVIPNAEANPEKSALTDTLLRPGYLLISLAVLLGLCAYLLVRNRDMSHDLSAYRSPVMDSPIWRPYLESPLPTLILLGDHFFFTEEDSHFPNLLAIRDGKINSAEDLSVFQQQHPEMKLKAASEPYFPYHSVWSLPPVLSLLNNANKKIVLRRTSTLGTQVLDEYNIIYLGSIKTLYMLNHMLGKTHIQYEISPHKVRHIQPDTSEAQTFKTSEHSPGPNDDLVIVLKIPGPANNHIMLIASFHSLGTPEIVNYLVNPETRSELESRFIEKFGEVPPFFELVFRVTGIDKTAYTADLLVIDRLPAPPGN